MPDFLHNDPEFKELISIVAANYIPNKWRCAPMQDVLFIYSH